MDKKDKYFIENEEKYLNHEQEYKYFSVDEEEVELEEDLKEKIE